MQRKVLGVNEEVTGGWSAHIAVGVGDPQAESDGVISMPCEYGIEPKTEKVTYRTEPESLAPKAPCLGSVNEPTAQPGNLCAYRGSGKAKEPQDKEAKFVAFDTPFGEEFANGAELNKETSQGRTSMFIVFRTTTFTEPTTTVPAAAFLDARGSWAVRSN